MSDRQFLPESENDYSIPKRDPSGFTDGDATLLADIGKKMNVNLARSEGRIPSPFSRAYLFYLNLFATGFGGADSLKKDMGRDLLQNRARQTFRGLLATFALRKTLGLSVEMRAVNIDPEGESVERLLSPATRSAPRGEDYWNPIRLYTVRRGTDHPREVLAGQSPLTGLFPAATPPKGLNALYWYDTTTGTWYDPTSSDLTEEQDALPVAKETKDLVGRLLKSWLEEAIETIDAEGLGDYGLVQKDESLLQRELSQWHDQIDVPADDRELERAPIRSQGAVEAEPLPFLNVACPEPSETIISDLPMHDGRLLVRAQDLTNGKRRLFGRVTGNAQFKSATDTLDQQGENLGRDLGLDGDALPKSYLYVNELFAPKLTPLTANGFSEEWEGIEIDGEHYLLPFHPDILNLMSPRELAESTSAERTFDGKYRVTLDYGDGQPIQKKYVEMGDADDQTYVHDTKTIPPERFDLRLFPNFSLREAEDILMPNDQKYYARVRLAPTWDFRVSSVHYDEKDGVVVDGTGDGGDKYGVEKTRVGNFEETAPGDRLSRGEALFITCEEEPSGFYVEGRGLCILQLRVPNEPRKSWEVGVDFGTSNTCVSYRPENPGGDDSPQIMELPVFTTTLFEEPSLNAEFENPYGSTVDERASSLLDFFYRQSQSDEALNPRSYFPTQFISRLSEMDTSPDWDFETGLIYFRNIGIGGAIDVQELIEGYPDLIGREERQPKRDFKAKQDLKWENTEWMEAFMRHLRKHVALTAAAKNAKITELKFSYPKAFTTNDRSRFKNVLTRAWGDLVKDETDEGGEINSLRLCSEAEAMRNKFVEGTGEYVILDIGGGTTDVIAFHDDTPIFQTSYRVAAGLISEYVAEAPTFRSAFLDAMEAVLQQRYDQILPDPLESKFIQKSVDDSVVKTIWIGLLNLIEQEEPSLQQVLHELRDPTSNLVDDEATEEAVRGFFLSVALLFTGSAYNAGILLHAASQGVLSDGRDGFEPEHVNLELTGNGSKLLRMLHESAQRFDPILQEALYHGIQAVGDRAPGFEPEDVEFQGVDRRDGDSPKVSVSLGLLADKVFGNGRNQSQEEVPLANIVAERGLDAVEGAGKDLVGFYEDAHRERFSSPKSAPELLSRYLETLGDLMPKGNNRGAMVLPRVGADWHDTLKEGIYADSRRIIDTRVKQNADELARQRENLSEDDLPALESLFVVELRALIEQVRKTYAK